MSIFSEMNKLIGMKGGIHDYYEFSEKVKALNQEIQESDITFKHKMNLVNVFNQHYSEVNCVKMYVHCGADEYFSGRLSDKHNFDIASIKVSICLPIYNKVSYGLARGIQSCLNQTHENIEVVCVNDCSTDNSLDVIKYFAQKDERIVVVDLKENRNILGARIASWTAATGDYIVNVDPDDWINEDYIEKLLLHAVKSDVDVVEYRYGIKFLEEKEDNREDCYFYGHLRSVVFPPFLELGISVLVWGKMYKKDVMKNCLPHINDLKGINNRDDDLLSFYLFDDTLSCLAVKPTGYNYCPNGSSVSYYAPIEKRRFDECQVFSKIISEFYCLDYVKYIYIYFTQKHFCYDFGKREDFFIKSNFFVNMPPNVLSTLLAFSSIYVYEERNKIEKHHVFKMLDVLFPKESIRRSLINVIYKIVKLIYKNAKHD